MKRALTISAAIVAFCIAQAPAQTGNPTPGFTWQYFGPTLGSGWGPILANQAAAEFYATNYGNCVWDATHDVGPCINTAIAVAYNNGNALGRVLIPAGTYGLATTIAQTNAQLVMVEGAGGPGNYGICTTKLSWIGAAGGVMFQNGPRSGGAVVGGGLKGLCLEGNATALGVGAGYGMQLRGQAHGRFDDIFIHDVQTRAIDHQAHDVANGGAHDNTWIDIRVSLQGAGSINATGIYWGADGVTQDMDTFGDLWYGLHVQYQNGIGLDCHSSDSVVVWGLALQPIQSGTGRSLVLNGNDTDAVETNLHACRSNRFYATTGLGNSTASTAPIAKDGLYYPSNKNYIFQNQESGGLVPVVETNATLTYDTNIGTHFSNTGAGSQTFSGVLKTGLVNTQDLRILYRASSTLFGVARDLYNLQNASGAETTYAAIDARIWDNTAGSEDGALDLWTMKDGTLTHQARISNLGALEVGPTTLGKSGTIGALLVGNNTPIQALDSTTTARTLLSISTGDHTDLRGGSAGLRLFDNWGSVTLGTSDGSGNFTFAQALKSSFNSSARPSSTTTVGFALTNNYDASGAVDFWNTVNSTGPSNQGFSWKQKTGASTHQRLSFLYGDATLSQFDIESGAAKANLGALASGEGYAGTSTNHPFKIYSNNLLALTVSTGQVVSTAGAFSVGGKYRVGGAAPALSSCGTSPVISGTDQAGEITLGTGSPTGCVLTFNVAYAATPYCAVSWQATPLSLQSYAVSTTAITLTQTATSSNKVNYVCLAQANG